MPSFFPIRYFASYYVVRGGLKRNESEYEEEYAITLFTPYVIPTPRFDNALRRILEKETPRKFRSVAVYGEEFGTEVSLAERTLRYWHFSVTHTVIRDFEVDLDEELLEANIRPRHKERPTATPYIERLFERIRNYYGSV